MSIEQKINTKLQSHPRIKKAAKRAYQRVMAAISSEQRIQGNIVCITPQDDCEYFYGYYDKSPWSMDGRYLLVMRAKDTTSSAAYSSQLDVCLIDTQQKNKIIKVAESNCWNTQQGCLAQWLGPDFKTRIIYNDFRNGSYCSAIFNVIEFHEEAALNFPIYEVTHDGKTCFSLDFQD